jgi:hypothetical protein
MMISSRNSYRKGCPGSSGRNSISVTLSRAEGASKSPHRPGLLTALCDTRGDMYLIRRMALDSSSSLEESRAIADALNKLDILRDEIAARQTSTPQG